MPPPELPRVSAVVDAMGKGGVLLRARRALGARMSGTDDERRARVRAEAAAAFDGLEDGVAAGRGVFKVVQGAVLAGGVVEEARSEVRRVMAEDGGWVRRLVEGEYAAVRESIGKESGKAEKIERGELPGAGKEEMPKEKGKEEPPANVDPIKAILQNIPMPKAMFSRAKPKPVRETTSPATFAKPASKPAVTGDVDAVPKTPVVVRPSSKSVGTVDVGTVPKVPVGARPVSVKSVSANPASAAYDGPIAVAPERPPLGGTKSEEGEDHCTASPQRASDEMAPERCEKSNIDVERKTTLSPKADGTAHMRRENDANAGKALDPALQAEKVESELETEGKGVGSKSVSPPTGREVSHEGSEKEMNCVRDSLSPPKAEELERNSADKSKKSTSLLKAAAVSAGEKIGSSLEKVMIERSTNTEECAGGKLLLPSKSEKLAIQESEKMKEEERCRTFISPQKVVSVPGGKQSKRSPKGVDSNDSARSKSAEQIGTTQAGEGVTAEQSSSLLDSENDKKEKRVLRKRRRATSSFASRGAEHSSDDGNSEKSLVSRRNKALKAPALFDNDMVKAVTQATQHKQRRSSRRVAKKSHVILNEADSLSESDLASDSSGLDLPMPHKGTRMRSGNKRSIKLKLRVKRACDEIEESASDKRSKRRKLKTQTLGDEVQRTTKARAKRIRVDARMRPAALDELREIHSAVKNLMEQESAHWFLEPVDPTWEGCETYMDEIDEPMDLGIVSQRLSDATEKNSYYKTAAEVHADIELIWSNCFTFNNKHDECWEDAVACRSFFASLLGLEVPRAPRRRKYSKKRRREASVDGEKDSKKNNKSKSKKKSKKDAKDKKDKEKKSSKENTRRKDSTKEHGDLDEMNCNDGRLVGKRVLVYTNVEDNPRAAKRWHSVEIREYDSDEATYEMAYVDEPGCPTKSGASFGENAKYAVWRE